MSRYIGEPMTVARLREELEKFPAEAPVVTVRDEEGNGFCNYLQVQADDDIVCIYPLSLAGEDESPQAAVHAALSFEGTKEDA